ncbi:MAG TPA: DUF6111 family protein [Hyphomicrobiaceae bacterium]|jgi:hypothetical protein
MMRVAAEIVLLFLLPTLAYLGYALLARPGRPARAVVDEAPFLWLALSGAVLVFATLIYYGSSSTMGGRDQTYTPARIKDGQIEPGHFK